MLVMLAQGPEFNPNSPHIQKRSSSGVCWCTSAGRQKQADSWNLLRSLAYVTISKSVGSAISKKKVCIVLKEQHPKFPSGLHTHILPTHTCRHTHKTFFKKPGPTEMVQQFRALTSLTSPPEDTVQFRAPTWPEDLTPSYRHPCKQNTDAHEIKINKMF